MKILVIGAGGREHALAWALARSPQVSQVFVAPGNGGCEAQDRISNLPIEDFDELIEFARKESVAMTVVGPEAPLAAGIVDRFEQAGLRIFGPSRQAAQLESSKDYAKSFMQRHGIPTAAHQTFSDAQAAHRYVDKQGAPIVIKADGLAAGKGVVVAADAAQAHAAIDDMLIDNRLGDAGSRVVIEDFLEGEEASFIALVDGEKVLALASSQDHKRLLDADQGPNTGGMGAYSPAPVVTEQVHDRIMNEVIEPTVRGMVRDGNRFRGFLYAGVMIAPDGQIKTLEFNCRMGDPETQPILVRLKTDLAHVINQAIDGRLDEVSLQWDSRCAMGVVLAAANYPTSPRKGDVIAGLPADNTFDDNCVVFHAGTKGGPDGVVTSGGRVLCVTALGKTVGDAREAAYAAISQISFDGMQFRTDIGYRALARQG